MPVLPRQYLQNENGRTTSDAAGDASGGGNKPLKSDYSCVDKTFGSMASSVLDSQVLGQQVKGVWSVSPASDHLHTCSASQVIGDVL